MPKMPRFHSLRPQRQKLLLEVEQLTKAKNRILDSYRRIRVSLKGLHDVYTAEKYTMNLVARYVSMKQMIKQITVFEKEYWTVVQLPDQRLKETNESYALRILNVLGNRIDDQNFTTCCHGFPVSAVGEASVTLAREAAELIQIQRLQDKSTEELGFLKATVQGEVCELSMRYNGLRNLVSTLHSEYEASKGYPMGVRYHMIKSMVKSLLRSPEYIEDMNHWNLETMANAMKKKSDSSE